MSQVLNLVPRQREPQLGDDAERARRLWPDTPALQAKWLRAVEVVRNTAQGWLLERLTQRTPQ